MRTKSDPAAWQVITGTARGLTHVALHLPNQDSAGSGRIALTKGVVAAVADGHGASRHFRSATGSMLAVRSALAVVSELTADAAEPWNAERAETLSGQLPQAIVTRWRELVARHLASHPYAPEEAAAMKLARDGQKIPYGSTLLVALIVGDWLVCGQIGDGDMLAVRPDGGAWFPVSGDDRLDGHHTTSLCQAGAVSSFRTAAHDLRTEPLLALLLGTDGYGNAQAAGRWQPAVARELAESAAAHDHDWFRRQVPLWAERCASGHGSGDDTTIALLLAPDSAKVAAAARAAAVLERATVAAADAPTVPAEVATVPAAEAGTVAAADAPTVAAAETTSAAPPAADAVTLPGGVATGRRRPGMLNAIRNKVFRARR